MFHCDTDTPYANRRISVNRLCQQVTLALHILKLRITATSNTNPEVHPINQPIVQSTSPELASGHTESIKTKKPQMSEK